MADRSLVEQVIDRCKEALFTGIVRFQTRQAEGELWFLSGILERVRFGVSFGDEAMKRLLVADKPTVEIAACLPNPRGGFSKGHPMEGQLGPVLPVDLLHFCEKFALTCTLELRSPDSQGEVVYRLGELVSARCDAGTDQAVAQMLQWNSGHYRFVLPGVEIPKRAKKTQSTFDRAEQRRLAEEAEQRRLAEEAEQRRLAEEAEQRRLAEEAEQRRLAEEAEQRRLAEEAEQRRLAEEAEQRRLAEEAEQRRLAEEAEQRRLAKEADPKRVIAEIEQRILAEAAEERRIAAEARKKRLAEEAEQRRLAEEAEAQRLAEEAEQRRLAEEAEAQRLAEEAEQRRLAEEAEQQRLAEEAEQRRLAEEAEQRRLAEEAEQRRLAEEAEQRRLAEQAEQRRLAEEARLQPSEADRVEEAPPAPAEAQLYCITIRVRRVTTETVYVSVPVTPAVMKSEPAADGSYRLATDVLFSEAVRIAGAPDSAWQPEGEPIVEVHPIQKPPGSV